MNYLIKSTIILSLIIFFSINVSADNSTICEDCNVCSCPNLMDCVGSKCVNKIIPPPEYKCTFCHGFCYANDGITQSICTSDDQYFEWEENESVIGDFCQSDSDCGNTNYKCIEDHCLIYGEANARFNQVKVTPVYSRLVKKGQPFSITIKVENFGNTPTNITLESLSLFLFSNAQSSEDKTINYNLIKSIPANSEDEFVIEMPPFSEVSMTAEIRASIKSDRSEYEFGFGMKATGLIIVYDENYGEVCDGLIYDRRNAVCVNGVLYPTAKNSACYDNSDCSLEQGVCFHYNCIGEPTPWGNFRLDRTYNVGVAPIFLYNDVGEYESIKTTKLKDVNQIAQQANDWFISERNYQNAENDFSIHYRVLDPCRLTKNDFLEIFNSCKEIYECEKAKLEKCGYYPKQDDIIARIFFTQNEIKNDPEIIDALNRLKYPLVAGLNLGDIIYASIYKKAGVDTFVIDYPSVLIHETLHSFGEIDLDEEYHFPFYQEMDCNLYRSRWANFEKYPHLCDWESEIIGWKRSQEINQESTKDLSIKRIDPYVDNDLLWISDITIYVTNPGTEDIESTEFDYKLRIPELNFEYRYQRSFFSILGDFFKKFLGMYTPPVWAGGEERMYSSEHDNDGLVLEHGKEYTIIVELDPDNNLNEIDETNNVLEKKISFGKNEPDYAVQDIQLMQPEEGILDFNIIFSNEGDTIGQSFPYTFGISKIVRNQRQDIMIGEFAPENIARFEDEVKTTILPGETVTETVHPDLDRLQDGIYFISVYIGAGRIQPEYNENIKRIEESKSSGQWQANEEDPIYFADGNFMNNRLTKEIVVSGGSYQVRTSRMDSLMKISILETRDLLIEGHVRQAEKLEREAMKEIEKYLSEVVS